MREANACGVVRAADLGTKGEGAAEFLAGVFIGGSRPASTASMLVLKKAVAVGVHL